MSPKRDVDSLDRCLKVSFIWRDSSTGKEKTWYVDSSYVEAEIKMALVSEFFCIET